MVSARVTGKSRWSPGERRTPAGKPARAGKAARLESEPCATFCRAGCAAGPVAHSPASLSAKVPMTMSMEWGTIGTSAFQRNRYAFGWHFRFQIQISDFKFEIAGREIFLALFGERKPGQGPRYAAAPDLAQMRSKIQDPSSKVRDTIHAARWPQQRGRCRACWQQYAC